MTIRTTTKDRLRLRRETLRELTTADLARVAAASYEACPTMPLPR